MHRFVKINVPLNSGRQFLKFFASLTHGDKESYDCYILMFSVRLGRMDPF